MFHEFPSDCDFMTIIQKVGPTNFDGQLCRFHIAFHLMKNHFLDELASQSIAIAKQCPTHERIILDMISVHSVFVTVVDDSVTRNDLGDFHEFCRLVHVSKDTSKLPFWLFNLKIIPASILPC
jgi:hypothetical protein